MASQMARPYTRKRYQTGKLRPHFDALEPRLALAGPGDLNPTSFGGDTGVSPTDQGSRGIGETLSFAYVSVSPSDGSALHTSPTEFSVHFNKPLMADSLSFLNDDLFLYQVINGQNIPVDLSSFNPLISLSGDQTSLLFTFDASAPSRFSLGSGTYHLTMNPFTTLMSVDGQSLAIDSSGPPPILSTFVIAPKGVALLDAQPLNLKPGTETSTTGHLDFLSNSYDVKLYRIDLLVGQNWLLGTEIVARRNGLLLDTSISLFDATGHVVRLDQSGNPIDPNGTHAGLDPYFLAGLPGGTYYLGISGHGNLGDDPGGSGYSPIHGFAGSVSQVLQDGGDFTIKVVADPVTKGATVTKVQVDHADPTRYKPTGLTLEFSGALQLTSLGVLDRGPIAGLELLDQNGVSWPINAVNYDAAHARLSLLFSRPLPVGQYQLRTPQQGGLVDLAGFQPTGQGSDRHLLQSFEVEAVNDSGPTYDTNTVDVGPFLPSEVSPTGKATVSPNDPLAIRVVVTVPKATYFFQTRFESGNVTLTRTNPDGTESNFELEANFSNSKSMTLTAGVYTFHVHANDSDNHSIQWGFKLAGAGFESLITTLIGQESALGFRLVSPTGSVDQSAMGTSPQPWGGGSPSFSSPPSITSPNPLTGGHSESTIAIVSANNLGFYPTAANSLVGKPMNDSQHLTVVGPTTSSGSTALAYNGTGLMSGIGFGQSISEQSYTNDGSLGSSNEPLLHADPTSGALTTTVAVDRQARSTDDQVLSQVSWAERMGNTFNRWRTRLVNVSIDEEGLTMEDDAGATELVEAVEEGRMQTADLSMPFGVGVVTYLAIRYRRSLTQWLRGPRGVAQLAMPGRPMGRRKHSIHRV